MPVKTIGILITIDGKDSHINMQSDELNLVEVAMGIGLLKQLAYRLHLQHVQAMDDIQVMAAFNREVLRWETNSLADGSWIAVKERKKET